MWLEAVEALLIGGSFIYHRWIEDHQKPVPAGAGDINVPRTDQGAPIPLIYGTCRVRAPVLAWAGNYNPVNLNDIGLGTADGFQYQIDLLFVIGIPFNGGTVDDPILYVADRKIFLESMARPLVDPPEEFSNPTADWFTVQTGRPDILVEMFGGYGHGGGVGYKIEIWNGDKAQLMAQSGGDGHYSFVDNRMNVAGKSSSDLPSYRQMAAWFLYEWSIGESPNITAYSFQARSLSTGTASDLGNSLTHDADPAAVILDLLTSPFGKLAIPIAQIDVPSFQAASATLFSESHGYSRAIEQPDDAVNIINDVLRQADGTMYVEPTTGKFVLKLIRPPDVNSLLDINPSNATAPGSGWYVIKGWRDTMNQVRVTFTDRSADYGDGVAISQNMANMVAQGNKIRNVDARFVGCCTKELAQTLAGRELAVISRPIVRATLTVNRTLSTLRPGDAVTLTWPELNVDHMVMRVAAVNFGQLHSNAITVNLITDMFGATLGGVPVP